MNESEVSPEILSIYGECLRKASQLPYNSATPFLRSHGYYVDPEKFGGNCVQKMEYFHKLLQKNRLNPKLEYIVAKVNRKTRHYAAVIGNYYFDPYIYQSEPFDYTKANVNGRKTRIGNLIYDLWIEGDYDANSDKLEVRWMRRGNILRPEVVQKRYNYDLRNRDQLPGIEDDDGPNRIFKICFAHQGSLCTIVYDTEQAEMRTEVLGKQQEINVLGAYCSNQNTDSEELLKLFQQAAELSANSSRRW